MKYSNEAKVGFFIILGLTVFFVMIIYLGALQKEDVGYPLTVTFKQVDGLKKGAVVKYAGVYAGKVTDITVDSFGVKVSLNIKKDIQIPKNAFFYVGSEGLMGEKNIDILVNGSNEKVDFLKSGDMVTGMEVPSFTSILDSTSRVLQNMDLLVSNINDIVGKENFKKTLEMTVDNIYKMSVSMADFSSVLQRMAANNEQSVNEMVQNLLMTAKNVNALSGQIKQFTGDVMQNGKTANDIKETINNIKVTSERVERMATALEPLITDPKVAEDIRVILENVREASGSANNMLKKFSGFKTKTGTEVMYGGGVGSNPVQANIDFTAGFDAAYLTAGIQGVGVQNKVNFQVGSMGENGIGGRVGAVNSEFGVGVDAKIGKSMKVSLDAYDPNDVRLKLRAQYNLNETTSIVAQNNVINKNRGEDSTTFVGVRKEF